MTRVGSQRHRKKNKIEDWITSECTVQLWGKKIFRDVIPCRLVNNNPLFEGSCCLINVGKGSYRLTDK
jgi:hypothetical protein